MDGFYYDSIVHNDGRVEPLKVRSLVGLIPLFAVLVLEPEIVERFKGFRKRMEWFLENSELVGRNIASINGK